MTTTTSKLQRWKDRVYELNRMSAAIHDERSALEQKIAEASAVWGIGQRVLHRGSEYEIVGIRAVGLAIRYFGRRVLKSGKLGVEAELWGRIEAQQRG